METNLWDWLKDTNPPQQSHSSTWDQKCLGLPFSDNSPPQNPEMCFGKRGGISSTPQSKHKMVTNLYGWIPDSNADNTYTQKGLAPSWFKYPIPSNNLQLPKINHWATPSVGCDQTITLKNDSLTRTASGYGGSSDEECSSLSADGSEGPSREIVGSEPDGLISEDESSQLSVRCVKCNKCSELGVKLSDLESKYDLTFIHNQNLIVDLSKCTEANMVFKNREKEFKTITETLKKDIS
ncbi:hypothetical protein Hanom_Chr12g01100881 [Helianthus anomalus]